MKATAKTTRRSPIHRLYEAAKEIVDGTRKVFIEQGQDAREVRLPILMHGTDMRVTIQAGPNVAARNAIEHAQMKASDNPPPEPVINIGKTLEEARMLIAIHMADQISAYRAVAQGCTEYQRAFSEAARCKDVIERLEKVERLV